MAIYYTKPHKRRPICSGPQGGLGDMQSAIPYGWCPNCGGEVFSADAIFCDRCMKEEQKWM